jgi:hypothetical protein
VLARAEAKTILRDGVSRDVTLVSRSIMRKEALQKSAHRGFWSGTLHKIRTGSDSDQPNTQLSRSWSACLGRISHKLTLWLVAIAPSSDFVLPDNSIPQPWIRLFVQAAERLKQSHQFDDECASS